MTLTEGGTAIFKNGAAAGTVPGVMFDHVEGTSPHAFVVLSSVPAATSLHGTCNDTATMSADRFANPWNAGRPTWVPAEAWNLFEQL